MRQTLKSYEYPKALLSSYRETKNTTNSHLEFKRYINEQFELKILTMIGLHYNIMNKIIGKGGKALLTV